HQGTYGGEQGADQQALPDEMDQAPAKRLHPGQKLGKRIHVLFPDSMSSSSARISSSSARLALGWPPSACNTSCEGDPSKTRRTMSERKRFWLCSLLIAAR